jgi:hypothetical protein
MEQRLFSGQATGVARQTAIAAQHAVARNEDAHRVAPHGRTHRPRGFGFAQGLRQGAVVAGVPDRYLQQLLPHRLLKGCALRVQRRARNVALCGASK